MEKQEFWSDYQPGFRFAGSPVGSREFFDEVTAYRDTVEPHIPEVVDFARWSGKAVLEAGCGIGTDGVRFAGAGAAYTGVDFSPTALSLARHRFELEGLPGRFVSGSVTALPIQDETFDLVFSHGVIHHVDDTKAAIREFSRVLKPGGTALIMVYHRSSLNYHVSIMTVRRALISLVLLPRGDRVASKLTGEPEAVLCGHKELFSEHGLDYLRDRQLFLNHNTDGPGNPLAKVSSPAEMAELVEPELRLERTEIRYLNLRLYPGGLRFSQSRPGRRLERRIGWHLYAECRKAGSPAR